MGTCKRLHVTRCLWEGDMIVEVVVRLCEHQPHIRRVGHVAWRHGSCCAYVSPRCLTVRYFCIFDTSLVLCVVCRPPGTGKTHLARVVASATKATFFCVTASSLVSKWMGTGEKTVRMLFKRARREPSAVIFIDEVDSIAGNRSAGSGDSDAIRRVKTELLVQMDGVSKMAGATGGKILVLAATNLPWTIDPAFRRRFLKRILIDLPDMAARVELFRIAMSAYHKTFGPEFFTPETLRKAATMADGYSGSDISKFIKNLCHVPVHMVRDAKSFVPFLAWDKETGRHGTELVFFAVSDDTSVPQVHEAIQRMGGRVAGPPRPAMQVLSGKNTLHEVELSVNVLFKRLSMAERTATKANDAQFREFTETYGQVG